MTIKQLSQQLGISPTTIWRYFKNPDSVKDSTRKIVESHLNHTQIIDSPKYKFETIYIIVPETSSKFYNNFLNTLMNSFTNTSISIQIFTSDSCPLKELSVFDQLSNLRNIGVIWFVTPTSNTELLKKKFPFFPVVIYSFHSVNTASPQLHINYYNVIKKAFHLFFQYDKNTHPLFICSDKDQDVAARKLFKEQQLVSNGVIYVAPGCEISILPSIPLLIKSKDINSIIINGSDLVPAIWNLLEERNADTIKVIVIDYSGEFNSQIYPLTHLTISMHDMVESAVDMFTSWKLYSTLTIFQEINPQIYILGSESANNKFFTKKRFIL